MQDAVKLLTYLFFETWYKYEATARKHKDIYNV